MIKRHSKLSTFIRPKVDSFIETHCYLCLTPGQKHAICADCLSDFPRIDHGCQRCGESVNDPRQPVCGRCLSDPPSFARAVAAFDYRFPLPQIIHQLKYQDKAYWARPLALACIDKLQQEFSDLEKPVLVPVPMHISQYRERRDNHAELLARYLARAGQCGLLVDGIRKKRRTPRQAELSGRQRRLNPQHSFEVTRSLPPGNYILIDDVMTTGSTLEHLSRALLNAGASAVYCFVAARRSLD